MTDRMKENERMRAAEQSVGLFIFARPPENIERKQAALCCALTLQKLYVAVSLADEESDFDGFWQVVPSMQAVEVCIVAVV